MLQNLNPPPFVLFCVYHNPADFPGKYVVRRWVGMDPDREPAAVGLTLDEVRQKIIDENHGLVCLSRQPGDDPVILETWI